MKKIFYLAIALIAFGCTNTATKSDTAFTTSPDGYRYRIVNGNGSVKADTSNFVEFSYKFYTNDTTLIEDSQSNPNPVVVPIPKDVTSKQVHPILKLLKDRAEGDSVIIVMKTDSIPGARQMYKDSDELTYKVKVEKVLSKEEYDAFQKSEQERMKKLADERSAFIPELETQMKSILKDYKRGKLELQKLDSGLEIHFIEKGSGSNIKSGDMAEVEYFGVLKKDGTMFDTSFKGPSSFKFPVGQGRVIKGWDEGLQQLSSGDKAVLFIPSALGYGAREAGKIPANSDLVFYIEVK